MEVFELFSGLRQWLGLERNIIVMFITLLTIGIGEELWTRYIPKYLEMLGAGVLVIAFYGTQKDLLDAVYQYPGGWLADRLGRRAALTSFTLLAIVGYSLYLLGPSWEWIIIGTFFVMAWSSLTLPAIFAIVGDNLPKTRRAIGFGVQSLLRRVPMVLAPPVGGWLIISLGFASGIKIGFGVTVLLALTALIIVMRYYVESAPSSGDKLRFIDVWRQMGTSLRRLLVADILTRWADGIIKVFIIFYVIDVLGSNTLQFGWLTSAQMLVATLSYIPIAKLSDRMNRKPFVLLTFAFFAVYPLILVNAINFYMVLLAFVLSGLREIGEPARKALIVDLSNEEIRGRAIGMYYLLRGLVIFPASLVGGLLWTLNKQLPFYVAFLIGAIGFLTYVVWGPSEPSDVSQNIR